MTLLKQLSSKVKTCEQSSFGPVLNTSPINGMRELISGISGGPLNRKLTPFLGLAGDQAQ